ncbi:uncharacterized protein GGS22DRAFT_151195 [Annulohypoxylon maeteangense]|uniref:uncharacterized protein n=1 Tax=Annulohypoxylon maeteangense TaxID=1927788 RepID=UPI0020080A4E|nr:uncharacterized protein GGS22DRAFT_151195 [Annulohypoxylon maeteangense]KAI0890544.1 hypothetical protein GGS22DRAFT_151195 [Annulohypoxylon maeteangense]
MGASPKPAALIRATGDSSLAAIEEGNAYYIYASSAGKYPSENIDVLKEGSLTDLFVASLNEDKVIILSEAPKPTASLDDSDTTKQWLQEVDIGATASLTVSGSPQKIESFLITLSEPWELTFSSASDVLLFTFGAPVVGSTEPRIQPPGIDSEGATLICGLDFTQTEDITGTTLKDLFTYANVGSLVNSLPRSMVDLEVTLKKPTVDDAPQRNAFWFTPGLDNQIDVRLQFRLSVLEPLQQLLGSTLKGFTLESADVVFKKKTVLAETENGDEALSSGSVSFGIGCHVKASAADAPQVSMAAGVEVFSSAIALTFIFRSADPLTGILRWLAELIGDTDLEKFVNGILNKQENSSKVFRDFTLRRLTVGLNTKDSETPKLSSFSFDIEVSANFGGNPASSPAVFLISYNWDKLTGGFGTLSGQLWNEFDTSNDLDLLPYEEIWTILQPVTKSPAKSIQIASLIPTRDVINIPDTLPSEIERAYISLSKDTFDIGGTATAKEPQPGNVPQPTLGELSVDASFQWDASKAFTLDVGIRATIIPSEESNDDDLPAVLVGNLSYDSAQRKWALHASLSGLYASTLVEFFDEDAKAHVGPLMQSIEIETLDVNYTYEPSGDKSKTSSFSIQGDLIIAELRLGLDFTTDKDGVNFVATLNPKNKDTKVGDVLSAIFEEDEIELPPFITDMVLVDDNEDAFRLEIAKKTTKINGVEQSSFQFLAQINIGNLHVAFAQLHSEDWVVGTPSKRLIMAAINGFPDLSVDIPLIGELEQPLDELYFLWVQAPLGKSEVPQPNRQAGLTRKDLAQLNDGLQEQLLVKDKFKEPTDKDLLVQAGCHFAVIIHSSTGERSCLLDYAFMKPVDAVAKSDRTLVRRRVATAEPPADTGDDEKGESAQAPFKKKAGPLSITNVGLKYKNKKLVIMFDATLTMGPVGFTVLGFSLNVGFVTLDKIPSIDATVEGLAAAFEKPPLTLGGIIRHGNEGGADYYAGGMIVGFEPWQLQAAGFYGEVTPKGHPEDKFKSIFVFAKLDGPLITLEFAEISGICGGFGYNSNVRLPGVDQVTKFPFVANDQFSSADNVLEVLEKLIDISPSGWFQPLDSSYWAAIGMKVDAFQMLSVDAVVVVQFGSSMKLGIFAVALGDIPSANSPIKFAHVELGIAAVADLDYGTLKIEAQLSPRSYIFSQECHLTGGAALCYWFDATQANKGNVGNFVFTLGGYHQAYVVPLSYPNPPRLGIYWNVGGGLSISGQAYFAITPKCCMGGGRLHAAFRAGPIEAWFDAFVDVLINYKPFFFNAQGGISVGVRFNIDFLVVHTHISVEIGAQLYLWGPPVAGRVHVDFWIVAFDINFGKSANDDERCTLYQFYQLVLQSESASVMSQAAAMLTTREELVIESNPPIPKNEGHNFLAQSGLMNPDEKTERAQNEQWIVRAGTFSFVIACKMAINAIKNDPEAVPIIVNNNPDPNINVFGKPMKLVIPMTSTLTVVVKQDGVDHPDVGWQYERYLKSVPQGLWAKYDRNADPHDGKKNTGDLLKNDAGSMSLMMGVKITAPKPQLSDDPFPAFNVDDANLQRLLAEKAFPPFPDADQAWAPDVPLEDEGQFDAVYTDWTTPSMGDEGQKGFVSTLAQCMTWDDVPGLKEMASIPTQLAKKFKNLYVAAPLIIK